MDSPDWLIIGGGIHGTHAVLRLTGEAGIPLNRIRVLDPHPELLWRWNSLTRRTGMSHLRSSSVHHLDIDPVSLRNFTSRQAGQFENNHIPFIPPYRRPSLYLFNSHCRDIVQKTSIQSVHLRGWAQRIDQLETGKPVVIYEWEGKSHRIRARNIILSPGSGDSGLYPSWARNKGDKVKHIFDEDFHLSPGIKSIAIIGGGITAAQAALKYASEGREVTILSHHNPRIHQFDSEPGWIGPKFMKEFLREGNMDQRRLIIDQERHPGSMPGEVHSCLQKAIKLNQISWITDSVMDCNSGTDSIVLSLESGRTVQVDFIVLATGFGRKRPGGSLVNSLISESSLPCASCSFPIVDPFLRWHKHIYVWGGLAELELGPTARNIVGARRAGDRLLRSLGIESRHAVDFGQGK